MSIAPIPMILYCPNCGMQHIDAVERQDPNERDFGMTTVESRVWTNPPHRTHLCANCSCKWRPADVPTTGVAEIKTTGKADTWPVHNEEVWAMPAYPKGYSRIHTRPSTVGHSPEKCRAAFEWLRDLATSGNAPEEAGIALDLWHASALLTKSTRLPTDTPIVGEAMDLLDEGFRRAEIIWEQKPSTPDEATIFEFLTRKYVQRADARQADLGLQYMEAETHDLARELAKWLKG